MGYMKATQAGHRIPAASPSQVAWCEMRDGELFFVIADLTAAGWRFFERSTWEVRYYERSGSAELVLKANQLWEEPPDEVCTLPVNQL